LREKIKYYLAHDEERRAIARQGFEEVTARHTYQRRMEEMISVLQCNKNFS